MLQNPENQLSRMQELQPFNVLCRQIREKSEEKTCILCPLWAIDIILEIN